MKYQRHKRKESFSVLVVSNTDRSSRQFQITLFTIRMVFAVLLLLCAALGWLIFLSANAQAKQQKLKEQLAIQGQAAQALEKEKESWNSERMELTSENETLRQIIGQKEAAEGTGGESAQKDPTIPTHYPSKGSGVMEAGYSEEHPYMTMSIYKGSNIVAAGDGAVVTVSSDDTYRHIVEIQHESGYITRYLCHNEADIKTEEGAQVQAGDILLEITTDETKLDYQVLYENEAVDPLTVIEAKG